MSNTPLSDRHCQRETRKLKADEVQDLLGQIHADWSLDDGGNRIQRCYRFKNYYQTIAFVNALAWIAHAEDHHPDIEVGYNRCLVRFSTHAIGGLSDNDFICAARIDALLPGQA